MLPDEIKPVYTLDKLLSNITDPDYLKKQIDDIFELATEMKNQIGKGTKIQKIDSSHIIKTPWCNVS